MAQTEDKNQQQANQAEQAPKEKHDISIAPHRRVGAEFASNIHTVTAEAEHEKEDILKPIYWAHCAHMFRPYDEIKVRRDDGTFYARLLVLACDRLWAKVHVMEWHNLTTADVSLTDAQGSGLDEFELKYNGPHKKWCVIRKSDRAMMREGEQSRQDAHTWVAGYVKVISG